MDSSTEPYEKNDQSAACCEMVVGCLDSATQSPESADLRTDVASCTMGVLFICGAERNAICNSKENTVSGVIIALREWWHLDQTVF